MTTDELRAKFENWWLRNGDPFDLHKVAAWASYQAAHASRDAEVEALSKDAERYRWLRDETKIFEHYYCDAQINADAFIDSVMRDDKE